MKSPQHHLLFARVMRHTFSTKVPPPQPPLRPQQAARRRPIAVIAAGAAVAAAVAYDGGVKEFETIGGIHRFLRCVGIAATISADYAWNLRDVDDESSPLLYAKRISEINQRSADRLLNGCLANGGLYVKIGQGVSAINHILPREYTETLKKLEVNISGRL